RRSRASRRVSARADAAIVRTAANTRPERSIRDGYRAPRVRASEPGTVITEARDPGADPEGARRDLLGGGTSRSPHQRTPREPTNAASPCRQSQPGPGRLARSRREIVAPGEGRTRTRTLPTHDG